VLGGADSPQQDPLLHVDRQVRQRGDLGESGARQPEAARRVGVVDQLAGVDQPLDVPAAPNGAGEAPLGAAPPAWFAVLARATPSRLREPLQQGTRCGSRSRT
jgi:hypothetical protein